MSTIISLSQPASPKEFHVCIMCVKQKEKPEVSDEEDCNSANSSRALAEQLDSVSIANCANGSVQLSPKNEKQSNECEQQPIPAYCKPIESSDTMNNATNMCSNHVTLSMTAPAAVSAQSDQM